MKGQLQFLKQNVFKLADRMRSMRTNGASKNQDYCIPMVCIVYTYVYLNNSYGMYTYGIQIFSRFFLRIFFQEFFDDFFWRYFWWYFWQIFWRIVWWVFLDEFFWRIFIMNYFEDFFDDFFWQNFCWSFLTIFFIF